MFWARTCNIDGYVVLSSARRTFHTDKHTKQKHSSFLQKFYA